MKTKKTLAILTTCLLLMSLFVSVPALAAKNYLTESIGFEREVYESTSTFDGWNIASGAASYIAAEVTSDKKYSGSKSLKVTILDGTSAKQIGYLPEVNLPSGKDYKFSMMVCIPESIAASEGNGGVQVRINNTANGTKYFGGGAYHETGDDWVEISGVFTATGKEEFFFRFRDGAVTNGVFYVDDITVYSVEELEAEAAAEAALRFDTTSSYVKGEGEYHLDMEGTLVNPDNATDSACVFYGGSNSNAKMEHETTIVKGGEKSLKMTLTADSTDGAFSQAVRARTVPTFVVNTQYEASVWVNIPDGQGITAVRLVMDLGNSISSDLGRWVQAKLKLTTTNGKWMRIGIPFTPTAAGSPSGVRLQVDGSKDAYLYWDDLMIVKKQNQSPVLQLLKTVKNTDNNDFLVENTTLSKGAFTVKYDVHKAGEATDKALVAAIYKTVNGKKQLTEVNIRSFAAADTAVSLPMTGIAETENASDYSMKVMLWNSLTGMENVKRANISFQ